MSTTPTTKNRVATTAGRFYDIDGTLLPSVTTILQAIGKPMLVNWAAKVERIQCVDAATDLYDDLCKVPADKRMNRMAYKATLEGRIGKAKASTKLLEKAGDIGTRAHELVEWNIRKNMGQMVGPEPAVCEKSLWAFMACEDWIKQVDMKPIAVEQVVFSTVHGFAGTMDLLADVTIDQTGRRLRALIDWKTGKAIYPESYIQNAAYQVALCEMGHGPIDCGIIVRLPKTENDPDFEARMVPPASDLFPVFLATYQLWKWQQSNEADYQAKQKQSQKTQSQEAAA